MRQKRNHGRICTLSEIRIKFGDVPNLVGKTTEDYLPGRRNPQLIVKKTTQACLNPKFVSLCFANSIDKHEANTVNLISDCLK